MTKPVKVAIVGDASQLQRELARAEGQVAGFGTNAQRAGDRLKDVFISGAVLYGIKKLADGAAELEQAVGGTAAVFGTASGTIDDFAKSAAETAGLSEKTARTLTSQLGASLKGLGLDSAEAAKQAVFLTQTGADLAATLGGSSQEAVTALGAAFRGEFDPLERFGIALKQSDINAKAVAMGLADSESSVSNYAKGQAALALITERSAFAQGQFAEEADTAAGAASIASAKAENAADDLGAAFLPIYTKIAEVVGATADAFSALPGPVQTGVVALAGAVIVGPKLVGIVGDVTAAVRGLPAAFDKLAGSAYSASAALDRTIGTAGKLGVWAVAIAAVTYAYKQMNDELAEQGGEIQVATRNAALSGSYADLERRLNTARQASADLSDSWDNSINPIEAVGSALANNNLQPTIKDLEALNAQVLGLADVTGISRDNALKYLSTQAELGITFQSAEQAVAAYTGEVGYASAAQKDAAATGTDSAQSIKDQKQAAEEAKKAFEDWANAITGAFDADLKLQEAAITTREKIAEYNEAMKDSSLSADQRTQAGIDLQRAMLNESQAAVDLAREQYAQYGVSLDAADAAVIQRDKLIELAGTLAPGSPLRAQMEGFIGDLQHIIDKRNIDILIKTTAGAAIGELALLEGKIRQVNSIGVTIGISQYLANGGVGSSPLTRAFGGEVQSGNPYLVGERGPEMFVPDSFGSIINAATTKGIGGGSSSSTYSPTFNIVVNGGDPEAIVDAIRRYERVNGTNWRNN